ncbi:MAG TPA: RNA polymerase sigma factor [Gaiellaceae bacterium]|nr:RNA polymerase sigma factor [Gaiellaceae bacterium]
MEGLAELAFRRHHAQIYRYLRRRTGDPHRAEDLAQEVFADAAVALLRGEQPSSMLAWLYTIAQRRFADEARRRSRSSAAVYLEDMVDELVAPEYAPEIEPALRESLQRLAPEQRTVVSMKLLRGCSFQEIATALGVSEAAAKMRFQRALGALRADLTQQGIGR